MEGQGRTLYVEWLCGGWKRERARACTFLQTRPSARQEWARGQQQTSHTLSTSHSSHVCLFSVHCAYSIFSHTGPGFSPMSLSLIFNNSRHNTVQLSLGTPSFAHAIFTFIGFTLIITLYPLFVAFFFCFFSLRFTSSTNT